LGYLAAAEWTDPVKAIPGFQQNIPIWLLGSSLYSAQLAAKLGLPFAFASHFAPDFLPRALSVYRETFQPSRYLDKPYSMAVMNVFAADTDEQARQMMSSMQLQFCELRRGNPGKLPAPIDNIALAADPYELAGANHALTYTAVGTAAKAKHEIRRFVSETAIDEVMLTCHAYEHDARLKSFALVADALAD